MRKACWAGSDALIADSSTGSAVPSLRRGRARWSGACRRARLVAVVAALAAGTPGIGLAPGAEAAQHPPRSLYSSLALKSCRLVKQHRDGHAWICAGLNRIPVYVAEGDGRFFLAAGKAAQKHRAARQTLAPFNTPLDPKSNRITVEWRVDTRAKRPAPYAMIVRYFTSGDAGKGEVLVVSRIAEGESCHVAYVDALANPDAIVMARTIADEKATTFDCGKAEPAWVGAKAKS